MSSGILMHVRVTQTCACPQAGHVLLTTAQISRLLTWPHTFGITGLTAGDRRARLNRFSRRRRASARVVRV